MNSKEPALIILTPGFAASEADSTCLPMQQHFVQTLRKIHPRLQVIILSFQYPYHKKKYKWFDVTIIPFDGRNKGGISRLLLRRKVYATLKKIYTAHTIVGLLSFWYGECAFVGKRFSDKYGLRHYCWISGQDAKKENKYPARASLKAGELIALSDFLQNEFAKNHSVKPLHVIPPGIATIHGNAHERKIDFLAAGSLLSLKQYHIFIEIIAEIKETLPDVKAMLIGNGPEMERLKTLIATLGIEKNIILTGELPHPEVLHWMQQSKVLLHPSSYEGFSGVCLEALSAGACVISFCKPMKHDIEHWHIVKSKEEMLQMALKILKNPQLRNKGVSYDTMEDTVKKMMKLFLYKDEIKA